MIAILGVLSAALALANDFKTINGKEYKNVTVNHTPKSSTWPSFRSVTASERLVRTMNVMNQLFRQFL